MIKTNYYPPIENIHRFNLSCIWIPTHDLDLRKKGRANEGTKEVKTPNHKTEEREYEVGMKVKWGNSKGEEKKKKDREGRCN